MNKMNREQFFKYHANSGGKLLSCWINNKMYHLNRREWDKLPKHTTVELPCGQVYKVVD